MERRSQFPDRRKNQNSEVPSERRRKSRRKDRNFQGSPPAEDITIDIADEDKVLYWATELNISADELKNVVRSVGASVKGVRDHLGK